MASAFGLAVPLLLSAAFLCLAQAPTHLPSASETRTIAASIEDADSGKPLSNTSVKVQLFPPEHGARKLRSLFCVPSDDAQPLLSFDLTTDQNGSFSLSAPGGPYLAKVRIPQRQPVFGCVLFDTDASVRACGIDPSSLRLHQHLFIRTANSIPGFSGDILSNSACAAYQPSPCDPLQVPDLVQTKKIVLHDFEGNPISNAHLDFHEYTKGKGKLVASLTTDTSGVADVSSIKGRLRMSIASERASGEFVIDFATDGVPGQQTIKLFHWRCKDTLMQGAMVQP